MEYGFPRGDARTNAESVDPTAALDAVTLPTGWPTIWRSLQLLMEDDDRIYIYYRYCLLKTYIYFPCPDWCITCVSKLEPHKLFQHYNVKVYPDLILSRKFFLLKSGEEMQPWRWMAITKGPVNKGLPYNVAAQIYEGIRTEYLLTELPSKYNHRNKWRRSNELTCK